MTTTTTTTTTEQDVVAYFHTGKTARSATSAAMSCSLSDALAARARYAANGGGHVSIVAADGTEL